jgi:predicted nucleotidyltransferase
MRLAAEQAVAIKSEVSSVFGTEARVWLFGSRIRDDLKGGDIDLYVELPARTENVFARTVRLNGSLQMSLGEQRIDIVTHLDGAPLQPVHLAARCEGVPL